MPPLEELIGGSTSDLVSEALKKVIPYPPDKTEPKSERPPTLTSPGGKSKGRERKQKKSGEKTAARVQYTRVRATPATPVLGSETPVPTAPGSHITGLQQDPAAVDPSTTGLIMPDLLLDEVLPTLNTYEQVLLVRLYRLSYAFGGDTTDHVGKKALADRCNMSVAMVKKVLKSLEGRGLIEKILDTSNDPNKGNRYRVLARVLHSPVGGELGGSRAQAADNLP